MKFGALYKRYIFIMGLILQQNKKHNDNKNNRNYESEGSMANGEDMQSFRVCTHQRINTYTLLGCNEAEASVKFWRVSRARGVLLVSLENTRVDSYVYRQSFRSLWKGEEPEGFSQGPRALASGSPRSTHKEAELRQVRCHEARK